MKYEVIGNEITFLMLPTLGARAETMYKVTVTAAVKGDARFKVTLTSAGLTEPLTKQESTRVYDE